MDDLAIILSIIARVEDNYYRVLLILYAGINIIIIEMSFDYFKVSDVTKTIDFHPRLFFVSSFLQSFSFYLPLQSFCFYLFVYMPIHIHVHFQAHLINFLLLLN